LKTSSLPWSSEKTREYWNLRWTQLRPFTKAPSTEHYRRREIQLIQNHFGDLRGRRFLKLDLWNETRNTEILFWVVERGAEVFGVDIADEIVREAEQHFLNRGFSGTFETCDIRALTFGDGEFDLVYSMGTVEHLPNPEASFREMFRVLKAGGKAIIGVPNSRDPFLRPLLVRLLDLLGLYLYAPERAFSPKELANELSAAGFKVTHTTGILFMPWLLRVVDILIYQNLPSILPLSRALLSPFEFLESRYPGLARLGYLTVCVAEK
jgi:SAM-dependent methyltransferase